MCHKKNLNVKVIRSKNCLEATQADNKIRYLEKNKINADSLKKS